MRIEEKIKQEYKRVATALVGASDDEEINQLIERSLSTETPNTDKSIRSTEARMTGYLETYLKPLISEGLLNVDGALQLGNEELNGRLEEQRKASEKDAEEKARVIDKLTGFTTYKFYISKDGNVIYVKSKKDVVENATPVLVRRPFTFRANVVNDQPPAEEYMEPSVYVEGPINEECFRELCSTDFDQLSYFRQLQIEIPEGERQVLGKVLTFAAKECEDMKMFSLTKTGDHGEGLLRHLSVSLYNGSKGYLVMFIPLECMEPDLINALRAKAKEIGGDLPDPMVCFNKEVDCVTALQAATLSYGLRFGGSTDVNIFYFGQNIERFRQHMRIWPLDNITEEDLTIMADSGETGFHLKAEYKKGFYGKLGLNMPLRLMGSGALNGYAERLGWWKANSK